jgi:hypothetical protein
MALLCYGCSCISIASLTHFMYTDWLASTLVPWNLICWPDSMQLSNTVQTFPADTVILGT